MRCVSTRGLAPPVSIDAALQAGLAPDGGLYVPERIPRLTAPPAADATLADTACALCARVTLPANTRYRLVGAGLAGFAEPDGNPAQDDLFA